MTLVAPAVCRAQLSEPSRAAISAAIQTARQDLDAEKLPDYQRLEAQVLEAAQGVEEYFRPITSEANLAKWKAYLAIDPLVQSIRSDAADDTVLAHALRTHGRLIGRAEGLELPPLVLLRNRLEQLIASMRYQDPERSIQFVEQQLQSLNERIAEADAIPSAEEAASLEAIARVVGDSNLAPGVHAALQNAFSRPNLVLSVSSSFVQRAASQVVCRTRPIDDCILGTRIKGCGTLQGTVNAQTLPSIGQAAIQLTLTGRFNSQNVGYNGPVTLNTLGSGDVTSSRTLYVSEGGVSLAPTMTSATLSSQITSINHHLRLVRKIASKRAAQQKPLADAIATEKFRRQVGAEFDEQVSEAVFSGTPMDRQTAISEVRTTLLRLDVPEPRRTIGSTSDSIFVEAVQAAGDQLAAINAPPQPPPGSYDLAVQLHESLVNNVATRVLAGRTMTGEQLDQLMADAGRPRRAAGPGAPSSEQGNTDAGDDGGDGEADEPFVIDFARFRPVIFEARDQSLKVGLRGTRFAQGDRELRRPIEITAIYRALQAADGSMYLQRDGDVGVEFPGGRRLTITQVALRRSIQRAFDDRFPQQLLDHALALPATLPIESLRGQTLRASSIDSQLGWLSVTAR